MASGRTMSNEKRLFIEDAEGRCQLCGRIRDLELHHIIPLAYGGPDIKENWIMICRACHALLTPQKALTQAGLKRAKRAYVARLIDKTVKMLDEAFPDDEWMMECKDFIQQDCRYYANEFEEEKED